MKSKLCKGCSRGITAPMDLELMECIVCRKERLASLRPDVTVPQPSVTVPVTVPDPPVTVPTRSVTVPIPSLVADVTVLKADPTINVTVPDVLVTVPGSGVTVPKNRAWEQRNPEKTKADTAARVARFRGKVA